MDKYIRLYVYRGNFRLMQTQIGQVIHAKAIQGNNVHERKTIWIMKVHEENKLMALLMLDYTEEQAERIVACITSIYTDESDLEELVYKIDNDLED